MSKYERHDIHFICFLRQKYKIHVMTFSAGIQVKAFIVVDLVKKKKKLLEAMGSTLKST